MKEETTARECPHCGGDAHKIDNVNWYCPYCERWF